MDGRVLAIAAATFFTAVAPAAANHRDNSLQALWLFDEKYGQAAYDISGHGNHGVLGSTTGADANDPVRIPGAQGYDGNRALYFDGADFVTVPDSTTLEPAELTVSAFVRAGSSPGTYKYVVSKGALQCYSASYGLDTGPTAGMYFYISNGSQVVRSPDAGPGIWDGRWHWIVGTFDGATVRLYVDRVQVGDGTPTDVALQYGLPDNERFYVGDYRGTCTAPHGFTGSIDAPFVLRRAVSPERD